MKVVCIACTHDQHEKIIIPECDLLIHAGDFTCHRVPIVENTIRFNDWLGTVPATYKVIVAGNHDVLFEKKPGFAQSLMSNGIYLQNKGIYILGQYVWGSPYTPFWDDWAFGERGESIKRHWKMIPGDTDILVTHAPPFGVCDETADGRNAGCPHLRERLKGLNVKLHVFGNIHEGYGVFDSLATKFVNASQVDEQNNLKNKPIEVEL